MDIRKTLDRLLLTRRQAGAAVADGLLREAMDYARTMARVDNVVAVVSDLADGSSRIVAGGFASALGLEDYTQENSIWENRIIALMPAGEQEEKYAAELRFFHFLRRQPRCRRGHYYLVTKLRCCLADGSWTEILHRMHYLFAPDGETVRCAICTYGPLTFDFKGKSHAVDSVTGIAEELTSSADDAILSRRERQILSLINSGLKSADIAARLNISVHTVSRHRQEILARLQVRNSHEACRRASTLGLLEKQ